MEMPQSESFEANARSIVRANFSTARSPEELTGKSGG